MRGEFGRFCSIVVEPFPHVTGAKISKHFVSVSKRLRNWWQIFPIPEIAAFLFEKSATKKGGTTIDSSLIWQLLYQGLLYYMSFCSGRKEI